jgi:hypothetical protein
MGHSLTAFIGRPDVLRRMANDIPGMRLVEIPQGFALAPMPQELLDALTLDHSDQDSDLELGDQQGSGVLTDSLSDIASAAAIDGPLGWIQTDWFGGVGETWCALWKDRERRVGITSRQMLSALGAVCVPWDPNPSWLTRITHRLSGTKPTQYDEWDSLDLASYRHTDKVWGLAHRVDEVSERATENAMLSQVYARLESFALHSPRSSVVDPVPALGRLERAYLFETTYVALRVGVLDTILFTSRQGGALGAVIPTVFWTGKDEVVFDDEDERRLRASGWRARDGRWDASWPDAEQAIPGLLALATLPSKR